MPVVITGDMTKEEVDEAMIEDLRQQVATGNPDGATLNVTHAQAVRLLELLEGAGAGKSAAKKTGAFPAAAVDEDDDDEDEKPKPKRR